MAEGLPAERGLIGRPNAEETARCLVLTRCMGGSDERGEARSLPLQAEVATKNVLEN